MWVIYAVACVGFLNSAFHDVSYCLSARATHTAAVMVVIIRPTVFCVSMPVPSEYGLLFLCEHVWVPNFIQNFVHIVGRMCDVGIFPPNCHADTG